MHRLVVLTALVLVATPAMAQTPRCPAPARPVAAEQMVAYVGFLRSAAESMAANDAEGFADSQEQVTWRDGWLGYLCSDATAIETWREQNDLSFEASPGCLDITALACTMSRDTMVADFRDAVAVIEACNADLDRAVAARTQECAAPEPTADLPSTEPFNEALTPYGSWAETPDHGRVWFPSAEVVGAGWRPFQRDGHWSYTDRGWTWVSQYPWGWAPFHYGRWGWHGERRAWYWIPGRTWAPATVEFRYTNDGIGWAPLRPVGVAAWPIDYWTYVPPAHIYSPTWAKFVITGPRMRTIHGSSTVVDIRIGVGARRGVFGPPIQVVRRTGVTVRPVSLRTVIRVAPPPRVTVRVTALPSGRRPIATATVRPVGGVMRPAIPRPAAKVGVTVRVPARPTGPAARPPALRAPAPPPKAMRQPRPRPATPVRPAAGPAHAAPKPAAHPAQPAAPAKAHPSPAPKPAAHPAQPAAPAKAHPSPAPKPAAHPAQPAAPAKAHPSPAPTREPKPAAAPRREPQPAAAPKREPKPAAAPRREPPPAAAPKREPKPAAAPRREPQPAAAPKREPKPAAAPRREPPPAAAPKREPKPAVAPKPAPKPAVKPKPAAPTKHE